MLLLLLGVGVPTNRKGSAKGGKRNSGRKKGKEERSDRSERQRNVFLHKLFSVNYARYASIILKDSRGGQQRAASQLVKDTGERALTFSACRQGEW